MHKIGNQLEKNERIKSKTSLLKKSKLAKELDITKL